MGAMDNVLCGARVAHSAYGRVHGLDDTRFVVRFPTAESSTACVHMIAVTYEVSTE
jgi:hypothetical protein